jgi:hypothetical protein
MSHEPPGQDAGSSDGAPAKHPTFAALWKFLAWLIPVGLGVLAPWCQPIFNFDLISSYFQRTLNPLASLASVVTIATVYIHSKTTAKERLKRRMLIMLGATVVGLLVCFALNQTVGEIWDPKWPLLGIVVWGLWIMVYLAMIISYSWALALLGILFVEKR